jgi:hypothetical protein
LFPLFATGINNTSSTGGKFAAGVIGTGGKLATSVDTSGAPSLAKISDNFRQNLK